VVGQQPPEPGQIAAVDGIDECGHRAVGQWGHPSPSSERTGWPLYPARLARAAACSLPRPPAAGPIAREA
jgi:hypothetical protein